MNPTIAIAALLAAFAVSAAIDLRETERLSALESPEQWRDRHERYVNAHARVTMSVADDLPGMVNVDRARYAIIAREECR